MEKNYSKIGYKKEKIRKKNYKSRISLKKSLNTIMKTEK